MSGAEGEAVVTRPPVAVVTRPPVAVVTRPPAVVVTRPPAADVLIGNVAGAQRLVRPRARTSERSLNLRT